MKVALTKSITEFAREIGVKRATVGDIIRIDSLPTEQMQHGMAKGLSPKVQRHILKRLGLNRQRRTAETTASASA